MKKELKDVVKARLAEILKRKEEPPEWEIKTLKLTIGFLAVEAKLSEHEYGGFFDDDAGNTATDTQGQESGVSKRKAGAASRREDKAEGS